MIVKMKFLSITGPRDDIDRVVDQYLSKYEIHLENALSKLNTVEHLRPYMEANPYRELLSKAESFCRQISVSDEEISASKPCSREQAQELIQSLDTQINSIYEQKNELESQIEEAKASLARILPFSSFDFDLHTLLGFRFISLRFGKIEHEYYSKLQKYIYDDLDTIFFNCYADKRYVWGVYFVPSGQAEKIDAVYSSMHFERTYIPDCYNGTPKQACDDLKAKIRSLENQIADYDKKVSAILMKDRDGLMSAKAKIEKLFVNFDVRKLAACTTAKDKQQIFYILCGWMAQEDAVAFQKDIENDDNIFCILEDDDTTTVDQPPTKLKNPKIFKPFEMFIRMYGLPSYNEIDPTVFVGLTYAFIFGAMFGDVGLGLLLAVGGFLLYRFKKISLAAIISCAGVFSTIFGFLFGSVFGFEDVIEPLWLRPVNHMTTIPFIGKLNTVFIVAIAFGMILILITMIFHIINGLKSKDVENTWFDTNGLAGFVFYGAVVASIVLLLTGHTLPAGIVMVIMFGVPLLLIALKEPLSKFVQKRADYMPKQKGMFVVQTFFELFEVLLSYFSNTLSFVRIGAFAVSHAAMMEVVLMLAGAENGASPNWIVIVLGNLFVCGMEGLIVGIQVLRLEYYEMFSRFYHGTGHEFQPFGKKLTK